MKSHFKVVFFMLTSSLLLSSCHILGGKSSLSQSYYPPSRQKKEIETAKPGRYLGFARFNGRQEKMTLFVDLIEVKAKKRKVSYKSIIRLNLGGFTGSEFHGEYYSSIIFDRKSHRFLFPQDGKQPLQVVDAELKAGRMLVGKLRYQDTQIGDFMAVHSERQSMGEISGYLGKMYPDLKVTSPVNGSYVSTCGGRKHSIELTSSRWRVSGKSRKLFSEFKIQGFKNNVLAYPKVLYDAVTGDMLLGSSRSQDFLSCSHRGNQLQCGSCDYQRTTKSDIPEGVALRQVLRPARRVLDPRQENKNHVPLQPDFPGAIEGEYFGYLFNETTLGYQPVRLKVNADISEKKTKKKSALEIMAIANLFFGQSHSNEFVVYPFDKGFYSDSAPYYVFDGKGESFFQVSRWYERSVEGIWYSKTYGRVGTLVLHKDLARADTKKYTNEVRQLSGTYSGPEAKFSLLARSGVSMNRHDFFPLGVKGMIARSRRSSVKGLINGVSLDFHTGRFAMMLSSGEIVVGSQTDRGVELSWGQSSESGLLREAYDYQRDPFRETSAKQMYDLIRSPFYGRY